MLPAAALLCLAPLLANAKLWGWPDDFAIVEWSHKVGENKWDRGYQISEGWGNWCSNSEQLQVYVPVKVAGLGKVRKENAAWMDLIRVDQTDTYDIYEDSGHDSTVHGQCQYAGRREDKCGGNGDERYYAELHCWQT